MTRAMGLTVEDISPAQLETLPLMKDVPFQSAAGWWRAVSGAALPDRHRPSFPLVRQNGVPVLLMPLAHAPDARRPRALTTPYTCLYQPVVAEAADLEAAGAALARHLGPALQIDAIDPAWSGWDPLLRGFRSAGHRAMSFASFGNWYEPLEGRCWDEYLATRPGPLREIIRRRVGRAQRDASLSIDCTDTPDTVEARMAEYEQVYAQSWKPAEPFPRFTAMFAAEAAEAGVLRLAVLRRAGTPLAAQYWTVEQGVATVLKLAHVEAARAESPGTVLTTWMIRRLIEKEQVAVLDFGRGDDPYKRQWASRRRQRGGLIIGDPWRLGGAAALLRQAAGKAVRTLRG